MKIIKAPSVNFDERPEGHGAEYLILHYTAVDFETSLKYLCTSPEPHRVSSHYLICEEGHIYQLVDEEYRAWHAGARSAWEDDTRLNAKSIGIELVNPGHGPDMRPFALPQMQSLLALSRDIIDRYQISPFHVLGHSDIAPSRKQDPGELFDWQLLAEHGIGIMPPADLKPGVGDDGAFLEKLIRLGYRFDEQGPEAQYPFFVKAFQMHYGGKTLADMHARVDWLLGQKLATIPLKRYV